MNPFTVAHAEHIEQTGIAISEHVTPILDATIEGGVRYTAMIGVLWNDHRTPSPSYHSPNELQWLDVPSLGDDEEEDESEDDINDEEEYEDEEEDEETDYADEDAHEEEDDIEDASEQRDTHINSTEEIAKAAQA